MSSATQNFTLSEFARRIQLTRTAMEQTEIELLIIVDPSNMNWLTGYDGWSFYTHQCVLVSLSESPVWWGRQMDANGALRTVYMTSFDVVAYPDHYVMTPECHPNGKSV